MVYIHIYIQFLYTWLPSNHASSRAVSTASVVCSTTLCTGTAGPQLSVAINSRSPMRSTAASKNLLYG